jgi:hypothetical protein
MEEEGLPMSSSSRTASAAVGLAGAGLLLAAGGLLHPRVDTSADFEQGLAGMFERSAWVASHAITLAGFVLLAVSLAGLLRGLGPAWSARRRVIGWTVVAGAGLAAVESVPHLLAASEADALIDGASTPLTDLHSILQAIATPVLGLSVAALAVACAPTRALGSGRIAAAVAVVGGVAFALAGPAIAITHNPELSPLFVGSAGISIWLMVSGLATARRLAGVPIDAELEMAAAR